MNYHWTVGSSIPLTLLTLSLIGLKYDKFESFGCKISKVESLEYKMPKIEIYGAKWKGCTSLRV